MCARTWGGPPTRHKIEMFDWRGSTSSYSPFGLLRSTLTTPYRSMEHTLLIAFVISGPVRGKQGFSISMEGLTDRIEACSHLMSCLHVCPCGFSGLSTGGWPSCICLPTWRKKLRCDIRAEAYRLHIKTGQARKRANAS
jgi:hypothetical protein